MNVPSLRAVRSTIRTSITPWLIATSLALAACGGSTGVDDPQATEPPSTDTSPTTPVTDAPTTEVSTIETSPATEPTTTRPTTTEAPATGLPTTDVPTTGLPTTDAPASEVPTTGDAASSMGFAAALELLPLAVLDGQSEIAFGDLDAAAAIAGLDRPERTDVDAAQTYFGTLTGLPATAPDGTRTPSPVFVRTPSLFGPGWFGNLDEVDDELGWTPLDVTWFVEHSTPPRVVTVLGGDMSVDRLDAAMGERRDDVWSLGPADDGAVDPANRTAARQLGESLRVALDGPRLVVGRTTGSVTSAVAAAAGQMPTIAEHPVARPLADAMDAEGAYAATLFLGAAFNLVPPIADPDLDADALEDFFDQALPAPFVGLAVGQTHTDGDAVVVVAYAHPASSAADMNAAALPALVADGRASTGRPWSEMFDDVDVRVEGTTVVARLTVSESATVGIGYQIVAQRDALASHR